MFCPRCATENLNEQKYCRHCGLALLNVHRALNGQMDELLAKAKRSGNLLSGGLVNLFIFAFIALISVFFSSGRSIYAAINLILGLLITLPMLYRGIRFFSCFEKALDDKEKTATRDQKANDRKLTTAPTTAPVLALPPEPVSVTEHTTRELEHSEPARPRQLRRE